MASVLLKGEVSKFYENEIAGLQPVRAHTPKSGRFLAKLQSVGEKTLINYADYLGRFDSRGAAGRSADS